MDIFSKFLASVSDKKYLVKPTITIEEIKWTKNVRVMYWISQYITIEIFFWLILTRNENRPFLLCFENKLDQKKIKIICDLLKLVGDYVVRYFWWKKKKRYHCFLWILWKETALEWSLFDSVDVSVLCYW